MSASDIWFLQPGQTLQCRQWDGETVLYNDLSGDTHLFGDTAVVLLSALRRGPATRRALVAALEAEFDAEPAELSAEADALLLHLQRLFLVDTSPC